MRFLAAILLLQFISVLFAPAFIVADFMAERSHIERDLCVQRMVPEAERSCHGECCLKRRLDESGERERNMPTELRALRLSDMLTHGEDLVLVPEIGDVNSNWGKLQEGTLAGHPRLSAPVPWC